MSLLYLHLVVVLSAANLGAQLASDYYPLMLEIRLFDDSVHLPCLWYLHQVSNLHYGFVVLSVPAISHPFCVICWLLCRPSQFTLPSLQCNIQKVQYSFWSSTISRAQATALFGLVILVIGEPRPTVLHWTFSDCGKSEANE